MNNYGSTRSFSMARAYFQFPPQVSVTLLLNLERQQDTSNFVTIQYRLFMQCSAFSYLPLIRGHFQRNCFHMLRRISNSRNRKFSLSKNLVLSVDQTLLGIMSLVLRQFKQLLLRWTVLYNLVLDNSSIEWYILLFFKTIRCVFI